VVFLEELARIAEIEFSDIVDSAERIGTKLRIILIKDGFIDVWLSRKLEDRTRFFTETTKGISLNFLFLEVILV